MSRQEEARKCGIYLWRGSTNTDSFQQSKKCATCQTVRHITYGA